MWNIFAVRKKCMWLMLPNAVAFLPYAYRINAHVIPGGKVQSHLELASNIERIFDLQWTCGDVVIGADGHRPATCLVVNRT